MPETKVDWTSLRQRLDRLSRELAGEQDTSPEQTREVLSARALAIAERPAADADEDGLQVVLFTSGDERYALEARHVLNVHPLAHLTGLPGVESPVIGVVSWAGGILTVFDLRQSIGLPAAASAAAGWVLVIGHHQPLFGVLATDLPVFAALQADVLHMLPESSAVDRRFATSVTADAVVLLDGDELIRTYL